MNLKSLLFLLIFILWCCIAWIWYVCDIMGLCGNNGDVENTSISIPRAPILFIKNTDNPVFFQFEHYRDSIVGLTDSNKLDIVGYYFSNEENNTVFSNLGLARANKLKSYLVGYGLDSTKVSLRGIAIDSAAKDSLLLSTYVHINNQVIDINSQDVQIVTNYGVTEIYFPLNSTEEIKSAKLDSFLKKLVLESKEKKIFLTGHTDNTGKEENNKRLSLERCLAVKKLLTVMGMLDISIVCEGKGSLEPKADNNTSANRALNRRVEIKVQ